MSNTTTYLPLVFNHAGPWTYLLNEHFEGAWPSAGWTVFDINDGPYVWGKSSCRADSGQFSLWPFGAGSPALPCGANYRDNALITVTYGPFSLVGAQQATFALRLWLLTADTDRVCRMASLNGNVFSGLCTSGDSHGAFIDQTLDLSNVYHIGDLRGFGSVWVAIEFVSDSSGNLPEGAYVDNVVVASCALSVCPPLPASSVSAATSAAIVSGQLHETPAGPIDLSQMHLAH